MSSWGQHLRSRLLAGFVFLLPAVITLWLIVLLFRAVDSAFTGQALALLEPGRTPGQGTVWLSRLVALITVVLVLYVVGLVATNVFGRRLLSSGERAMTRVPVVGGVYGGFRQLLDAFGPQGGGAFRRCVLIEYPRRGMYRLAFVTNDRPQILGTPARPHLTLFVPMTPIPTSGVLLLVSPDECQPLALSPEEALKIIVSGGIVMPEHPLDTGARAAEVEESR